MQINQIASMIEWLDEERRRDKATIVALEERLAQQLELVDQMQRRVNSVESDQSVIKQAMLPAEREREILEQTREETGKLLENAEARRLTAEREAARRADLQREGIMRSLREASEKVDRLDRQFANIGGLQSEGDRLTNAMRVLSQDMDDLTKQMEGPDRRLTYLEEQRRTDARRLAEIETELPEYKKSVDGILPRMSLIEDLALRNERRLQDYSGADRERREEMQQFTDQQQLLSQQRDQQIAELSRRFGLHDDELQKYIERFEVWAGAYREMKRIIDDFNRIGDRLERRINEVAEMQRLSEERFRQEWNDWRDDEQKRWKQLTLANDEVWRNHDREFEAIVRRVSSIEALTPDLRGNIERLWQLERARAELYRDRYQALLSQFDSGGSDDGGDRSAIQPGPSLVEGPRAGGG